MRLICFEKPRRIAQNPDINCERLSIHEAIGNVCLKSSYLKYNQRYIPMWLE